jgi:hypothetical protein
VTAPSVEALRRCLDGGIASLIATCAPDGVPNVTCVSQVSDQDARHVALSFQFFNNTRENILADPLASVYLIDPSITARFRLALRERIAGSWLPKSEDFRNASCGGTKPVFPGR